jgi:hypothetical protein
MRFEVWKQRGRERHREKERKNTTSVVKDLDKIIHYPTKKREFFSFTPYREQTATTTANTLIEIS